MKSLALLAIAWASVAHAFTVQVDNSGTTIQAWPSGEIAFDTNYTDCLTEGATEAQLDAAIDAAFAVWNQVLTARIKLTRAGPSAKSYTDIKAQTTGGNPLILCDSQMNKHLAQEGETEHNTTAIPAAAQVLRVDSNIRIALAVVYINAVPGQPASVGQMIGRSGLLSIVLAHEFGHAIGLGHSQENTSLMYYDATDKTELVLSRDDAEGATYLYPRQELFGGKVFGCATLERTRPGSPGGAPLAAEFALMLAACAVAWRAQRGLSIS